MKKVLIGAGLMVAFLCLISASTINNIITYKPAKPISVIVNSSYYTSDAISDIKNYIKQGYIVKSVTNGGENAYIIYVLEKY